MHAKAPWGFDPESVGKLLDGSVEINAANGDHWALATVVYVFSDDPASKDSAKCRENARLIAAAPELLALLRESQDHIGGDWRRRRDELVSRVLTD